jgi:electron transport complex protein RnfB
MVPVTGSDTGWDAWSAAQADAARQRYEQRLARQSAERAAAQARAEQRATEAANALALAANTPPEELSEADAAARRKQAIIQAAIDRARLRRQADPSSAQAPDTTPPTSPIPPRHRS